jgi:outer membrane biosynthesis protein TonB
MKLSTGKRIGQSGQELLTAAVFSFVLHICAVAAVALFYISTAPKIYLPPSYDVKLVGLPAGAPAMNVAPRTAPAPAAPPAPAPAPPVAKPAPKPPAPKPVKTQARPSPDAVPELGKTKSKPEKQEPPKSAEPAHGQTKPAPVAQQQTPGPAGSASPGAAAGPKSEGVTVAASSQQDLGKFDYYLGLVRDQISRNWNPPPDAPDAKAHVIFSVNRSGWVGSVNVDEAQTKGTYAFKLAAMRAIQASNPFPPLPEDFFRQTLEFSVDLTPKE